MLGATVPWSSRTCGTTEITAFAEKKHVCEYKSSLWFSQSF